MTDGVRPIPPIAVTDRRSAERRSGQRRASETRSAGKSLVVTEQPDDPAEPAERATTARDIGAGPAAAFAAQLMGQGGQRNGIRGGPPVMDAARSTYLGAEYSGEMDRRPPPGKIGKTEV
jgi:hypothetical protein